MYSLAEAAALLGVAHSTLRHQAQTGALRATKVGKTYVVTDEEVERYRAESLGRPGRRVVKHE
jgi:excisionase family DNA binding protein